jgi:signal peptidase I
MRLFEILLVFFTVLGGIILLGDRLLFAQRRKLAAAGGKAQAIPALVEYARGFFPVLLLVLGLRSFVTEAFRIPSGSMLPTLLVGDFILVNKFAYGLRLPISNRKFVAIGEPNRGDVVVFKPPQHPDQDWIKRVIGLPGDTIAYHNHTLSVNGMEVLYGKDGAWGGTGESAEAPGTELRSEGLPGRAHAILARDSAPLDNQGEGQWVVPGGQYFVMGDNRDNSEDSRFWGFLPEANLRGKAYGIWMNFDFQLGKIGYQRIGSGIQ